MTKVADSEPDPQKILFLTRLMDLVNMEADYTNVTLSLFLTGLGEGDQGAIEHGKLPNRTMGRRIRADDLVQALDGYKTPLYGAEHDRQGTVCYVCGPPRMTDEFVAILGRQEGMDVSRVLCEKWW